MRKAKRQKTRFITTDYVLDETATLLKARGKWHLVATLVDTISVSAACTVQWTDPDRFSTTCSFFLEHKDHAWSFTDCLSFVVMKEPRLRKSLTKDIHFREVGFDPLLV